MAFTNFKAFTLVRTADGSPACFNDGCVAIFATHAAATAEKLAFARGLLAAGMRIEDARTERVVEVEVVNGRATLAGDVFEVAL